MNPLRVEEDELLPLLLFELLFYMDEESFFFSMKETALPLPALP